MKLILYNMKDDPNVLNKEMSMVNIYDINMKDDNNISAPVVRLKDRRANLNSIANYAYIEEFNRYYFVNSMVTMNNAVWVLQLSVDVLESFKDDIMGKPAEITRHMQEGDYLDVTPFREVRKTVDIFESDKQFRDEETILFTTIGHKIVEEG